MPVFTVNALYKRTLHIHPQWVGGLLWAKSCANVLITVWVAAGVEGVRGGKAPSQLQEPAVQPGRQTVMPQWVEYCEEKHRLC